MIFSPEYRETCRFRMQTYNAGRVGTVDHKRVFRLTSVILHTLWNIYRPCYPVRRCYTRLDSTGMVFRRSNTHRGAALAMLVALLAPFSRALVVPLENTCTMACCRGKRTCCCRNRAGGAARQDQQWTSPKSCPPECGRPFGSPYACSQGVPPPVLQGAPPVPLGDST